MKRWRSWKALSSGERAAMAGLLAITLVGIGVEWAKRRYPEWFYGPPDLMAEPEQLPVHTPALETPLKSSETRNEEADTAQGPTRSSIRPTLRSTPATPARLNLNTATVPELEALPGIGPTLAQRIVEYRQQHGPFQSVPELLRVRGIGPKRLSALEPLVTIGPEAQAPSADGSGE